MWVYFWTFYPVSLIYSSVFVKNLKIISLRKFSDTLLNKKKYLLGSVATSMEEYMIIVNNFSIRLVCLYSINDLDIKYDYRVLL